MLVAVGLVVLMMTLFTTIFQMATGSLAKQKALAEGDQRVRLVLTLLRGDLNNRTMKVVAPFLNSDNLDPNTAGENAPANRANCLGYFYLAENDRDDDTDDVLQLTVEVGVDQDRYYGAAKALLPDAVGNYGPGVGPGPTYPPVPAPPPALAQAALYWQNQPEFDDQTLFYPNQAGSSNAAEVCWFLRNGTLYRRVMLIRNTGIASTVGNDPSDYPSAPEARLSTAFYEAGAAAPRNFYSHFDYSVHYDTSTSRPAWHGVDDLNNVSGTGAFPLGRPNYRFGFNQANGLPREFTLQYRDATGTLQNAANDGKFIGRFTHEETSFINPGGTSLFGFPARVDAAAPNPMDPGSVPLTYNIVTGKVDEYTTNAFIPQVADTTQSRIAEDIVMTNVLRFDIKVFDEAATTGQDGANGVLNFDDDGDLAIDNAAELGWPGSDDGGFFDLGHLGNGFYSAAALVNTQVPPYCPPHPNGSGKTLYRYDTWHPNVDLNGPVPSPGPYDPPPFHTTSLGPAATPVLRPLRAIQIRITFFDVTSQTERDVTFVQTLKAP